MRVLTPTLQRSLLALLGTVPWACGWGRTRWSCATLALELQVRRGVQVSAETVRRWLHELGWVWKRAKLAAKDDDPQRVEKLARIRYTLEHLPARAALFFADEQSQQPVFGRKLVVIDEGDKVPIRVLNCLIARQRDILARLHAVSDRNTRPRCEVFHHSLGRLHMVVVGNHDRICE